MRVTIDIPDELMGEAIKHSGASTERQAVLIALEEYNRRRQARLVKHLGTFRDFMTARALRKLRGVRNRRHGVQ